MKDLLLMVLENGLMSKSEPTNIIIPNYRLRVAFSEQI